MSDERSPVAILISNSSRNLNPFIQETTKQTYERIEGKDHENNKK